MNGVLITIKGRYPEKGYVMNEACKELAYVIRGSGKISTVDETNRVYRERYTVHRQRRTIFALML